MGVCLSPSQHLIYVKIKIKIEKPFFDLDLRRICSFTVLHCLSSLQDPPYRSWGDRGFVCGSNISPEYGRLRSAQEHQEEEGPETLSRDRGQKLMSVLSRQCLACRECD